MASSERFAYRRHNGGRNPIQEASMAVKNEEETDRWRYSKFENVVFAFALAVAGVVLVTAGGVLLQELL